MNIPQISRWPWLAWAVAATLVSSFWGWPGALMVLSAAVFYFLLQFHRSLRVLQRAALRPLGQVPSAVAFYAQLHRGMSLLAVLQRSGSLGERMTPSEPSPTRWRWRDAGGDAVMLVFVADRLQSWVLTRHADQEALPVPPSP